MPKTKSSFVPFLSLVDFAAKATPTALGVALRDAGFIGDGPVWAPLDPVREASLRCVAGSHRWEKEVLPTRWAAETPFFEGIEDYMPVPDPEAEAMRIVEFAMEPGDAVAFDFRTLHGARGNSSGNRRRAFSLRLVGEDARYVERPGRTSPPYPGHGMVAGQRLREDWFPVIWPR